MKKKFWVAIVCLMMAALIVTAAGCSKPAAQEPAATGVTAAEAQPATGGLPEKAKVTYISRAMSDAFASALALSVKDTLESKYDGWQVGIQDCDNDAAKYMEHLENAIVQKSDVIFIHRVAEANSADIIQSAVDNGIVIVAVDNPLERDGVVSTITGDQYNVQKIACDYAAEVIPEGANVVVLDGLLGVSVTDDRGRAITDMLARRSDINLLDRQYADYNKDLAMEVTENWLQKFDNIDAVLAINDSMALGAIEAYKASNKDFSNVQFFGIDALEDGLLAIRNGELTATVLYDPQALANTAIDVMEKTFSDEITAPEFFSFDSSLVTKENVNQFS